MVSMSTKRGVNHCWRMLKRYYAMIVYPKMILDIAELFFIILDGLIGGKVDMLLHIEKSSKYTTSIENN